MKKMDDKALLEDILLTTKGACDLYMHGTIESETANVHCTFDNALSDTLKMQNDIFSQMSQKGWYRCSRRLSSKLIRSSSSLLRAERF